MNEELNKARRTTTAAPERTFSHLVLSIKDIHETLNSHANRAINTCLTIRNWLIGLYILEYEQDGADRAEYGKTIFATLSDRLKQTASIQYHARELRRCREFYAAYPEIWGTLSPKFNYILPAKIQETLASVEPREKKSPIRGTLSPEFRLPTEKLVKSLSYSHFALLIPIDNDTKRAFYELECIRGNWSVRELKRQIASLYYERSGLSKNKKKLSELAQAGAEHSEPKLAIRDPYVFEFLGIKPSEVMAESALEKALTDRLQDFLLELGHGFCFEARQKRILIGDTYGFVDLVFYHRILKCHVLIDLKIEGFSHENMGQLNTYVSWYRKNMMTEGDNPPIGILLCTQKDHALVEYALAGIDNQLFVSKYQLALPSREDMQHFLEREIAESDLPEDDTTTGRLVREMREKYRTTGESS